MNQKLEKFLILLCKEKANATDQVMMNIKTRWPEWDPLPTARQQTSAASTKELVLMNLVVLTPMMNKVNIKVLTNDIKKRKTTT